jgi:hypothetical protein
MIQNLINHIVFVIDASSSMSRLTKDVITVFDNQISYLAKRSREVNQETRVSVYLFADTVKCLVYDMDVMRLPSLSGHYNPYGNTALIDGTLKAISDLKRTPELYGDHAFLVYVQTDGEENCSSANSRILKDQIADLPENWTVAVLVPGQQGVFEAKKFGFPSENISIWDVSSKGIEESGNKIQESTNNFFNNRSSGIRGTKSLFKLNVNLTDSDVKNNLMELSNNQYSIITAYVTSDIKSLVEGNFSTYVKGSAYYQLTKCETVQSYKKICIKDKKNNKVYTGPDAKVLLGIPDGNIKIKPEHLGKFDVFIQSTSVNRKIPKGTQVIVMS